MPKIADARQPSRRVYLAGASMVALGVALAAPHQAQATVLTDSNGTITVSGGTTGGYTVTANHTLFTVTNTGRIVGSSSNGISNNGMGPTIGTITNSGTIISNNNGTLFAASADNGFYLHIGSSPRGN